MSFGFSRRRGSLVGEVRRSSSKAGRILPPGARSVKPNPSGSKRVEIRTFDRWETAVLSMIREQVIRLSQSLMKRLTLVRPHEEISFDWLEKVLAHGEKPRWGRRRASTGSLPPIEATTPPIPMSDCELSKSDTNGSCVRVIDRSGQWNQGRPIKPIDPTTSADLMRKASS